MLTLSEEEVGESDKRMAVFVRILLALSLACVCVCKAGEEGQSHWAVAMEIKHRPDRVERKSDDGKDSVEAISTGNRRRRSLSQSERTDGVTMMNNLRRTVGSSNMPYLVYSNDRESEASLWTVDCNFYKPVTPTIYSYSLKYVTTNLSAGLPTSLVEGFKNYSRQLSSVYLKSFGCDLRKCSNVTYEGVKFAEAKLTLCIFEAETSFNENLTQYTLGKECTTCLSGSYWCDGGLCRDDCSSQISTCSCFSRCTKCQDWNRGSCTCPSQPNASAVALDCYNKGEMAFKAEASMAIIIVSTLLLFGLQ